ncbi:MAG TPA: thiamine-phosphate kinase [Polyangiaceae bacterium]|nr:thiamine-phosphate kinase [Polyangiaceae bacterium]
MARGTRSETELIEALAALFADTKTRGGPVTVGIGDDAAVLRPPRQSLVWTVDTSVEGVHFERRWLSPADIGSRSFHAAVSDIAAMGARPVAALSSVIAPARFAEQALLALAAGQAEAASALHCPIVGGNLSRGRELSVTTTVLGSASRPLTRAGARAGDDVWLVGDVGLAGAGLLWLQRRGGRRVARATRRALDVCSAAWRRPAALVPAGARLVGRARAAIDVSDGLATDAGHLAKQSGVCVVLDATELEATLRPELVAVCAVLGVEPLTLALSGGEDYALVATGPRRQRPAGARRIGRVERGDGLELETAGGARRALYGLGFEHFGRRAPRGR